jgi:hypothetical protein
LGFVQFLHRALQKRLVLRSVQAFILTAGLLGIVLILTEQLRWLPWPMPVRRVLFALLFVLSSVCTVVFGFGSAFQVYYLRRNREAREKMDGMKIVQQIVITPATYFLSALWAWSWLGGNTPRRYGAVLVDFFVASNIVGFAYYMVKAFRQAGAARAARAAGGNESIVATAPRHAANGSRITFRRLQFSLRRVAWEVWWKASRKRRLSPLDRALRQAVLTGNVNNVEVFLHRGANANLRLLYNSPLLVISAGDMPAQIVRLLLDAGADINAASPLTGTTALAHASMKGHQDVVRLLLEQGAVVDAPTNSGATPLIFAASEGHIDCVRLLLAFHANVNAATKRGMTALMYAARQGSVEMAQALLNAGADADARTRSGRTALVWAEKGNHQTVAMLLQQRQSVALEAKD